MNGVHAAPRQGLFREKSNNSVRSRRQAVIRMVGKK
jgi:hypothetical protein